MTAQNPAIFLQAESHPAEDVRRWIGSLYDHQSGVLGIDALEVTEKSGTPDMSVDVATGKGILAGDESTYQGSYFVENRGTTNLAISAADGTNPRIDLVVAKVEDSGYSGATDEWSLAIVTGTPAASPVAPTQPATSLVLASVLVAAASSDVDDADITDSRTKIGPLPYSPGVKATRTTGQAITLSTHTALFLSGSTLWDTDSFHGSPATDFVVPAGRAGRYSLVGACEWATTTGSAQRSIHFTINGTDYNPVRVEATTSRIKMVTAGEFMLEVGDIVQLQVWQNQTSSLTIDAASMSMSFVSI